MTKVDKAKKHIGRTTLSHIRVSASNGMFIFEKK